MNRLNELNLTPEEIKERLDEVDTHQRLSRKTASFMGPLVGMQGGVTVLGSRDEFASRTRPSLLAPHHRSYWDIPKFGLAYAQLTEEVDGVPSYPLFVAKNGLDIPLIGNYFRRRGTKFVRRGEELEGQQVRVEINEALENGEDVVIMPKGTRKRGDDFAKEFLKRGIALVAMENGTPIRPFWLARTKVYEGQAIVVVRPEIQVEKFEVDTAEHDPERPESELNNRDIVKERLRRSKEIRTQIYTEMMAGKQIAEAHLERVA